MAAAIDFDNPDAAPLHFAAETVSEGAVTFGPDRATFYNVQAPDDATLTTSLKLGLSDSAGYYVRLELDGMVFSATPVLSTSGAGSGNDFSSTQRDVLQGGAGEASVVYRLADDVYASDLTFTVSIGGTLAVPAGEGRYAASLSLHNDLHEATDGEGAFSERFFGGRKTVVVMTSGLAIGVESGVAVADVDKDFREFTPESASGRSRVANNPSAPAVLGSISVALHRPHADGRELPLYTARGGHPARTDDLIETVSIRIEGDMTFGTFDLRTGTAADRCLYTAPLGAASSGGAIALTPPVGEETVTTVGTARVVHSDEPFGRRNLCVWLPEPERTWYLPARRWCCRWPRR